MTKNCFDFGLRYFHKAWDEVELRNDLLHPEVVDASWHYIMYQPEGRITEYNSNLKREIIYMK